MISANGISLTFGKRSLFKDVSIKFTHGNCYGLIGANGSGKSTFLKILSNEIDSTKGEVSISVNERIAILKQDHYAYNEYSVLHTVIMGHKRLYDLMIEKDKLYDKENFSEADGIKVSELEGEFAELNGWEAESEAAILLEGLGIEEGFHEKLMEDMEDSLKVRILLAQAIFGNPDILLLDEPTNNLDIESINWLEHFLYNFENTVIVVSHDRHFLNKVCTHIADIDYGKIKLYIGNYAFWQQASQIAIRQRQDSNKKKEEKKKELQDFIQRFSANASKAKQATSRKKLLEKIEFDDIGITSRKFPYIDFKAERECGKIILNVENLNKTVDGEHLIKDFSMTVNPNDKIAFIGPNDMAKTTLFQILMGELEPDSGTVNWGVTISSTYFPRENGKYFDIDLNLIDWLRQFSNDKDERFIRGFLGRMLFSGDESLKKVNVLSGGEKVRCMLSKMMLNNGNALILDEPLAHLDLEAITSLNNALIKYKEVILFSSHDHQFVETVANRIIEFTSGGIIDRVMNFEAYLSDENVNKYRDQINTGHKRLVI